jgi:hypothetical protein
MKTGGKKDQETKKIACRKYEKKELIQKGRQSKKRSGKNGIWLRRSFLKTQRTRRN